MSTGKSQRSLSGVETVFDADSHVIETADQLLPYVDDEFAGVRKIVSDASHPTHDIYSITHALPPWTSVLGSDHDTSWTHDESSEGVADVDTKIGQMDEFGIDHALVNPTLNLGINTVDNPRFAVALARAYNDWMLDEFLDRSDRLHAGVLTAPQRPDRSAEEIDRLADEDGIVAVQLPNSGLVPPAGHRMYDPIYEAAEKHNLPILIHSASGGSFKDFPTIRSWNETYAEDHMISFAFLNMWHLTSLMFQGVPERFPDLEFVFQESGVAWVPYWTWRLDDNYLEIPDEVPYLTKLPSEYVRNQFYFSTQPLGHTAANNKHMAMAIEMADPDSIMYSSDLPHVDFDPPRELTDRIHSHFDDDVLNSIMGGTAIDVFGIDG